MKKSDLKVMIKEVIEEKQGKFTCTCTKTIKFKNGLNFFKDFKYKCEIRDNMVSVAYGDGRFSTMSKEVFDEHFSI